MSQAYVAAQVFYGYVEVVVFKEGKLALLNTFTYEKKEDLAYYLLSVYDQLKLDPQKDALHLSGTVFT